MKIKILYILLPILLFAGGFYTAKKFSPTIETRIQTQEKEVVKNQIQTVVKTYTTDGKVASETITTDKSTILTDKKSDDKSKVVLPDPKKDWKVSLGISPTRYQQVEGYSLQIERRILGPWYLGVQASSEAQRVVVGFEF